MRPRRTRPPDRPAGAKLELTLGCNLRCGFCYTDSPRRTLERIPELDDDVWRRVVGEVIDLGVVEAVITGGEPLLRRELALEALDRFGRAGIQATLSTNGWFVDAPLADRLAGISGLRAQISVDGATPEVHDAARGLRGSWRRAVTAVSLLRDRGVDVHVVHVVTGDNEPAVPDFLELMWLLGVNAVRLTPVLPVGAAARSSRRELSSSTLSALATSFQAEHGLAVHVANDGAPLATAPDGIAPAAILIHSNGAAAIDSLHPFSFGNVATQPLGECWEAIVADWRDPRVVAWTNATRDPLGLGEAALRPYLDDDMAIAGPPARRAARRSSADVDELLSRAQRARPAPPPGGGDLAAARASVTALALSRRYRLANVRATNGDAPDRYVHLIDARRICRLNRTAAVVMDACAGGIPADAVDTLARRYPAVARETLVSDVLASARRLTARGVIEPALAPAGPIRSEPAATDGVLAHDLA